ncbi:MAG: methylated-DNA--[protein]-cysteine S-methyltransferase [Deltaproteobacteria bacterium]
MRTNDRKHTRPGRDPILVLPVPTPIGRLVLAATSKGVCRIELPGPNSHLLANVWLALHFPNSSHRAGINPALKQATEEFEAYFLGDLEQFSFPLDTVGTEFQRAVWHGVSEIPFGETRSYRDVAVTIGRARAVRAVGAANAANPLPIVVPCHRVIGSDGTLTGYAGGLETKRWLLGHEASLAEQPATRTHPQPPA